MPKRVAVSWKVWTAWLVWAWGVCIWPAPGAAIALEARSAQSAQSSQASQDSQAALESLVQHAMANNPRLKAAWSRVEAALEKVPQERSLQDPRLSLGWFAVPAETRVGPQVARLGLTQTIPWIGKLIARGDRAALEAEAEKARFDALRLTITYDVKRVWYELAALEEAVRVAREAGILLEHLEGVIHARYVAGMAPMADLLAVQSERDLLGDRVRTLEARRGPTLASLNAALHRPLEMALPATPDIPLFTLDLQEAALVERLEAMSPQLKVFEHLLERERKGETLARLDYIPDFTLGIETTITNQWDVYRGVDSTGQWMFPAPPPGDSGKDPVVLSLSFTLPIFNERRQAATREARARQLAAINDRDGLRDRLAADLVMARFNLDDAARKTALYREALLPRAVQGFGAAIGAYQAGTGRYAELIMAQRSLLELELNAVQALAAQGQRLAEIESLVGEDLPVTPAPGGSLRQARAGLERPDIARPDTTTSGISHQEGIR
ncbi:putative outer membrane efflux protein [Megalodesulfovibrio gigas DSM 1382 = ATCC 19364]|uniref:Putative outer membrane efflux protein n=1 Tax=Megalodesulfovibrio gigas (strain ATCC 19364 / DSM 1382 / NCIMB 9332 / VKM B-1759) TaxID=1121448 RepID=T2G9Z4_MEGG1|nr:putative outer membrane efflux protein [Megalodesulfovibrio gigas DSM 1382 = ATCC 19364]